MNKKENIRISIIITKSLHSKVKNEELNLSKFVRDSLMKRYKLSNYTHTHTEAKITKSDLNINRIIKWFKDIGFTENSTFHLPLLEKAVFPSIVGSDSRTIKKYISLLINKYYIEELENGEGYKLTNKAIDKYEEV